MTEPALRTEGLSKTFGGLLAVADLTIDVRRDEIHALIGPNGAGKTTVLGLLSGELPPSSGNVFIGARCVTRATQERRARAGLARSFQTIAIFDEFSVAENVRLAAQARARRPLSPFGRASADPLVLATAHAALTDAGLAHRASTTASELSHGEQRQLDIAMVLAASPRIVLLDEPLAGLGQAETQAMLALLRRLREGRAVLLVEHDMDAVFALADRVTVMANGRVIASGRPDAVRADAHARAAYLGPEDGTS